MTISIRLDEQTEQAIAKLARFAGKTKSELLRGLIDEYIEKQQVEQSPWELGKHLFGRESSGVGTLSVNRKKVIKDLINAKKNRH